MWKLVHGREAFVGSEHSVTVLCPEIARGVDIATPALPCMVLSRAKNRNEKTDLFSIILVTLGTY
jgi:hypothetical protein